MTPHEEDSLKTQIIEEITFLLNPSEEKDLESFLERFHVADIADALQDLESDVSLAFFQKVPDEKAVEIFQNIPLITQVTFLKEAPKPITKQFLNDMDSDNAVELLAEVQEEDEDLLDNFVRLLPKKKAAYLKLRLTYQEDTAGILMNSEYLSIPENLTVKETLKKIQESDPPESEISFYIYVVNDDGQLVGVTTLRDLIMAKSTTKVKEIRNDYPITVPLDTDQEEVARMFQKYDSIVMPVVDHSDHLMGIITVDDVVDVVVEEATEDIYKLSGTTENDEEKLISGSIFVPVLSRLPWLILTVLGGGLAAYIITQFSARFDASLFSLALTLSFVPLLMGLGGNVGNQSATIVVRGLATGLIKENHVLSYIFRELIVGVIIGAIAAVLVYLLTQLVPINKVMSLIVALSLFLNIILASLIGVLLPIIFKKSRIDPAVASAPFISSALDIFGQLIYFSTTLYILAKFNL